MTFKEFKDLHDSWREWKKKKPRRKIVIVLYYPFSLILFFLAKVIVISIAASFSKKSYRHSSKCKKVIKEGLFFDTIEYHEKEKTQS